jgi:hypothetical protein
MVLFYESVLLGELNCEIEVTTSVGVCGLTEMSVEWMALKYKLWNNHL